MHLSLYLVLLELSEGQDRPGHFAICQEEVMARAKLLGRTTYYKRMKELSEWGYIVYWPERYPGKRSGVRVMMNGLYPLKWYPRKLSI